MFNTFEILGFPTEITKARLTIGTPSLKRAHVFQFIYSQLPTQISLHTIRHKALTSLSYLIFGYCSHSRIFVSPMLTKDWMSPVSGIVLFLCEHFVSSQLNPQSGGPRSSPSLFATLETVQNGRWLYQEPDKPPVDIFKRLLRHTNHSTTIRWWPLRMGFHS